MPHSPIVATSLKSAAIVAGLVLFASLCQASGAVAGVAKEPTFQAATPPAVSHPAGRQGTDSEAHSRPIRRIQPNGWILSAEESPVARPQGSVRPLSTTVFPSTDPATGQQHQSDPGQWEPIVSGEDDVDDVSAPHRHPSPSSAFWRDNELSSADAVADDDDRSVQQLNWHEAQLARLHGLGPAEIAALSTWQHRLKIHPLPNRVGWHHQQQAPSFAQPRSPVYATKSQHRQQQVFAAPFDVAYKLDDAHLAGVHKPTTNATRSYLQEPNDNLLLLPLWPKRSSSSSMTVADSKKSERENKNRNAAGRKEKVDAAASSPPSPSSNGKNTKNAKNSRKQQQQQQQQQHQAKETSHRPVPSGNEPTVPTGKDGVVQHQHGRSFAAGSTSSSPDVSRMNRNLATQFLLRSPRENRQYDVPIIECPPAEDGMERFACPTPDIVGRYRCIDDHVLCDGFIDCPGGEDEDGQACMFYKTMKAHLDLVADALLRWVRGR